MSSEQSMKVVKIHRNFLQALKVLLPDSFKKEYDMVFTKNEELRVFYDNQQEQALDQFLIRIKDVLVEINLIKINMPERKVQRLMAMKKWKGQSQVSGICIVKVNKNAGAFYYLAGFASQLKLFEVYQRLQSHTYKIYNSNLAKYIYRNIFLELIKTDHFRNSIYSSLKITSTELKSSLQQSHKKPSKYLQFQFQAEQNITTVSLIHQFRMFLENNFTLIGFVTHQQFLPDLKLTLSKFQSICSLQVRQKNDQPNTLTFYVIFTNWQRDQMLIQLKDEHRNVELSKLIQEIRLLKSIGNTGKAFNFVVKDQEVSIKQLSQKQIFYVQNLNVIGKPAKNPEIFTIKRKSEESQTWEKILEMMLE